MKLIRLASRPSDWDKLIGEFHNKTLFHESAWLDFVVAAYPNACVEYFEIRRDCELLGYYCAIRAQKFLFSFWEGPQSCIYMSPLMHPYVDQLDLMRLLVAACRKERIAHLALCDPWLDPDLMEKSGFAPKHHVSQMCSLSDGKESVWARMDGTCRTRIRKAEKSGLTVESATDPGFVDEFYSRFAILLAHKGKSPGYSIDHMRQLFIHLGGADRLFALRVKHQGRVIAAAYYPHDERAMYFGDTAYEVESLPLCPNELLHWTAMQMAIERGIPLFFMGGDPLPSRFTRKFGGTLQPVIRYHRSFVPLLYHVRHAYRLLKKGKALTGVLWRMLSTMILPQILIMMLPDDYAYCDSIIDISKLLCL